jgi:hypothetical protein
MTTSLAFAQMEISHTGFQCFYGRLVHGFGVVVGRDCWARTEGRKRNETLSIIGFYLKCEKELLMKLAKAYAAPYFDLTR